MVVVGGCVCVRACVCVYNLSVCGWVFCYFVGGLIFGVLFLIWYCLDMVRVILLYLLGREFSDWRVVGDFRYF